MIISLAPPAPKIQIRKEIQVLLQDLVVTRLPFLPEAVIKIDILPVNGSDTGRVFRLFHAALDLKGIYAGIDEFRKKRQRGKVPHGNGVILFSAGIRRGGAAVRKKDLIRQSAGLRASSAVAAPAAEEA